MSALLMEYDAFIAAKTREGERHGFEPEAFTAPLKPFQRLAVEFALRTGRAALFEDTGLGKTRQFCEWAKQVEARTGLPVLIFTRLAVTRQTCAEAAQCGIEVRPARQPEDAGERGLYVTNYERLDIMVESGALARLGGVVLDESSILKNFMGKRSATLREQCAGIPYRLCATATPAPNDWEELGCHAEFLGVMSRAQMLATWFINDTGDTGTWRLKKHAREDFWRWVATWAACIFKPSDAGDSDEGYDLPPLVLTEERFAVEAAELRPAEDTLFDMTQVSAANMAREARRSTGPRAEWIARKVMAEPEEAFCIFAETNDEADAIGEALDAAGCTDWTEVRGSDRPEHKEERLWQFTNYRPPGAPVSAVPETLMRRVILTKPEIAGYGLNWQHCARVIFSSPDYSFEMWYQAVRRFYRFGQVREVQCTMLRGENMERVADVWRGKMAKMETMKEEMRAASVHLTARERTGMTCRTEVSTTRGEGWTLHHGDCVRVLAGMESESIGFSVFSPPFADLFTYSNDRQDMGNCGSMEDFMRQFNFVIRELLRVTEPGRLCAVHCVDLLSTKWKDGEMGYKDFSGEIARAFRLAGWVMWSRVAIWKCPVVEMTRTKAHGLLHKTLKKDSANSRTGSAEYLLVFKKRGENRRPIVHTAKDFPVSLWQEMASPFWRTVDQGDVLNGKRGENDEKHICPLQLGIIRRALGLWSAPGDLVFSPFAGIGSEGHVALHMGRRFEGAELKPEYFSQACANLRGAEAMAGMDLGILGDTGVEQQGDGAGVEDEAA